MSLYPYKSEGGYRTSTIIAKSDATVVAFDAIYVGGAGNVALTDLAGNVNTFTAVAVGTILPVACTKVMATNTTATLMVGLNK